MKSNTKLALAIAAVLLLVGPLKDCSTAPKPETTNFVTTQREENPIKRRGKINFHKYLGESLDSSEICKEYLSTDYTTKAGEIRLPGKKMNNLYLDLVLEMQHYVSSFKETKSREDGLRILAAGLVATSLCPAGEYTSTIVERMELTASQLDSLEVRVQ